MIRNDYVVVRFGLVKDFVAVRFGVGEHYDVRFWQGNVLLRLDMGKR